MFTRNLENLFECIVLVTLVGYYFGLDVLCDDVERSIVAVVFCHCCELFSLFPHNVLNKITQWRQ